MNSDQALLPVVSTPSATARWLGYAGLIPFVGLALAVALGLTPGAEAHARWLIGYAALIASFLGGIHWGLVMRIPADAGRSGASGRLAWGVTPSLLAWASWVMPTGGALLWLAIVLAVCFIVDRGIYALAGAQAWLRMRLQLTSVAVASCLLAAFSAG